MLSRYHTLCNVQDRRHTLCRRACCKVPSAFLTCLVLWIIAGVGVTCTYWCMLQALVMAERIPIPVGLQSALCKTANWTANLRNVWIHSPDCSRSRKPVHGVDRAIATLPQAHHQSHNQVKCTCYTSCNQGGGGEGNPLRPDSQQWSMRIVAV